MQGARPRPRPLPRPLPRPRAAGIGTNETANGATSDGTGVGRSTTGTDTGGTRARTAAGGGATRSGDGGSSDLAGTPCATRAARAKRRAIPAGAASASGSCRLQVVHASQALADQIELAKVVPPHPDQQLGVRETICLHVSGEVTARGLACRHQARLVSVLLYHQASTIVRCLHNNRSN